MGITATATLNNTATRCSEYELSPYPARKITKKQFLEELAESHQQILDGKCRDAFVAAAELRQKYGL